MQDTIERTAFQVGLFKIETGVQMPNFRRSGKYEEFKSVMAQLEVGQSVFVPLHLEGDAAPARNTVYHHASSTGKDIKVVVRSVKVEGRETGYRVWRVA